MTTVSAPRSVAPLSDEAQPVVSSERLARLIHLWRGDQRARFTLSTPDPDRRSAVVSLGLDLLDARLRQIHFFDTRDVSLTRRGINLWLARTQRAAATAGVTLCPPVPEDVPDPARGVRIEIDAVPGGYRWTTAMRSAVDDVDARAAIAGRYPVGKLFTKRQRALFAPPGSDSSRFDSLALLGSITVFRMRLAPPGFRHRYLAELWTYPNGSRVLELTTKCDIAAVFDLAAETRALLDAHGIGGLAQPRRDAERVSSLPRR
jgi:hypothetical protein